MPLYDIIHMDSKDRVTPLAVGLPAANQREALRSQGLPSAVGDEWVGPSGRTHKVKAVELMDGELYVFFSQATFIAVVPATEHGWAR